MNKTKYTLYMYDPKTNKLLHGRKEFYHSHPLRSYIVKIARQEKDVKLRLVVQ